MLVNQLLHDVMEGRDGGQTDQDGDRIASENACQKPAGNSRRLKKKGSVHNA